MDHTELQGSFDQNLQDYKIGIVISRWNSFVTDQLYKGALQALEQQGLSGDQITAAYCPGSYEIPFVARKLVEKNKIDGVITLGVVIRGETPHFDYVCRTVNDGVAWLNRKYDKPVAFGVLTTDTVQQALERAGIKAGNKGGEAALALLEMLSVVDKIERH